LGKPDRLQARWPGILHGGLTQFLHARTGEWLKGFWFVVRGCRGCRGYHCFSFVPETCGLQLFYVVLSCRTGLPE
jgi:hypothetical protein